jgi:hypothetical protein
MKTDEVLCPACGSGLVSGTSSMCYHCKKPVYLWQDAMEDFMEKKWGRLILAVVVLQFIIASIVQGHAYVPFRNGFTTDGVGMVAPFIIFYFLVVGVRGLDKTLRFLWPGKPYPWKIAWISLINLLAYLALVYLLGRYVLPGYIGIGNMGDSVNPYVIYQSGRPVIDVGNGAYLLGIPGLICLLLLGAVAELLKITGRIYPDPGFPDVL